MIHERPLAESDRDWLEREIAHDPLHSKNGMTPDSFLSSPDSFSICYADESGPLFVVKYTNVLKADIQFCRKQATKRRIVHGFMDAFRKVMANAKSRGYKRVLVNTESSSLRLWCAKHLGFKHFKEDLSRML